MVANRAERAVKISFGLWQVGGSRHGQTCHGKSGLAFFIWWQFRRLAVKMGREHGWIQVHIGIVCPQWANGHQLPLLCCLLQTMELTMEPGNTNISGVHAGKRQDIANQPPTSCCSPPRYVLNATARANATYKGILYPKLLLGFFSMFVPTPTMDIM